MACREHCLGPATKGLIKNRQNFSRPPPRIFLVFLFFSSPLFSFVWGARAPPTAPAARNPPPPGTPPHPPSNVTEKVRPAAPWPAALTADGPLRATAAASRGEFARRRAPAAPAARAARPRHPPPRCTDRARAGGGQRAGHPCERDGRTRARGERRGHGRASSAAGVAPAQRGRGGLP